MKTQGILVYCKNYNKHYTKRKLRAYVHFMFTEKRKSTCNFL